MLLALLVAVLAVALGAALTAVSGARPTVLGLLRTFAATAAAAVVLTHLLPDALSGAGLWGALAFAVGLLGPLLLHPLTERLALRKSELSARRVALEAGFIGLLVHHVGDGLGIGAYAALPGGVLAHLDVILALIAHTVPLVAVVTLAYRGEYGLPVALRRVAALAVASAVGVGASFAVPGPALASAGAWIGALVSGVLLHVVTHDWLEDLPQSESARLADLGAAALGLSLVMLGGHEPGHEAGGHELLEAALATAKHGAPFLLLGLGLTFWLGDKAKKELKILGKSLPVVLTQRLGFALGAEGLALGLATYGIAWTLAAVLATTLVPIVAGAVAMLAIAIAGEDAAKATAERLAAAPEPETDRLRRFDRATAIWVVAVAVSAVFALALPDGALYGSLGGPGELVLSGALGSLFGTGGPSVVALGALTAKGLSPGAALLGATISSALGAKVLLDLARLLGVRGVVPVVIWLLSLTGALAIGINQVAPIAQPLHFPDVIGSVSAGILLLLIVVRAERVGVRRWLAGWFAGAANHGEHHHHHHGHAHDHAHSSEIPNGNAATTRSPAASGPSAEA
ncbi:MAG TPA: hypothetical protein VHP33_40570 [Polyangiaceae bacterium]|nr:hypothetical protein [Polyangiaceae bacterium]